MNKNNINCRSREYVIFSFWICWPIDEIRQIPDRGDDGQLLTVAKLALNETSYETPTMKLCRLTIILFSMKYNKIQIKITWATASSHLVQFSLKLLKSSNTVEIISNKMAMFKFYTSLKLTYCLKASQYYIR